MTAPWDPEAAKRRVAQLREDDARMTPGPWDCIPLVVRLYSNVRPLASDSIHVARLRNNAESLADLLEAAMVEIERLRADHSLARSISESLVVAAQKHIDEADRLRPVVDACVRVAELDEILDAHPGSSDAVGIQAERELYDAVAIRAKAIDTYRAVTEPTNKETST